MKRITLILPALLALLLLSNVVLLAGGVASSQESEQVSRDHDRPLVSPTDGNDLTGSSERDGPVTTSGSETVLVNNTFSDVEFVNGSLAFSIGMRRGYSLERVELETSSVSATDHLYYGYRGDTSGQLAYAGPGDQQQARAQKIDLNHKICAQIIHLFVGFVDNASWGVPSTLRLELRETNTTDYPSGNVVTANVTEFHDNLHGQSWDTFLLPSDVYTTSLEDHWLVMNASLLNGTGTSNSDRVVTKAYLTSGAVGEIGDWADGDWTLSSGWTYPMMLLGYRVDENNDTFTGIAESFGLGVQWSDKTSSFSGDDAEIEVNNNTDGSFNVALTGNLSCLATLSWSAVWARARDRSHPAEQTPGGRLPPPPGEPGEGWQPTFMQQFGWYIFWVIILSSLTVGLRVFLKSKGTLAGYSLLVYVVVMWIYYFWNSPVVLATAVEWGNAIWKYLLIW